MGAGGLPTVSSNTTFLEGGNDPNQIESSINYGTRATDNSTLPLMNPGNPTSEEYYYKPKDVRQMPTAEEEYRQQTEMKVVQKPKKKRRSSHRNKSLTSSSIKGSQIEDEGLLHYEKPLTVAALN